MILLICAWTIASFLTNQVSTNLTVNDIANRLAFAAGYSAVLAGLWFTYQFPVVKKVSKATFLIILLSSTAIIALSLTSLVSGSVALLNGELVYTNGPLILVYIIAFICLILLVINNLVRLPKGLSKKYRRQATLILIAFAVTAGVGLVFNVLIPSLTDNWQSTELGPIATLFLVITITYAMIRHGLFDIRSAVMRTVAYLLSLGTLAAVYFAVVYLIFGLVFGQTTESGQLILNVLLTLLLCFLFQPIKRFFDKLTNKVFYHDDYNIDDFFAELSQALTSTNDLHSLLQKASEKIAYTVKAAGASFVIYIGNDRSDQIGSGSFKYISYKEVRWLDDFLGISTNEPKVLSLLDDEEDELLRRMMVSHHVSIILPLVRQGLKMGYLFLGEHKRSKYNARDIRVVRSIADELVIAIQNALSVEQIKELNSHLEQRVDAATKELRRSNAQLQKLDEAKDDFISMASHQLRTPLTSIKGYISMMMEGDVGKVTPEQEHVLNEAFISSERMVRLISDFLNVSRLQTGKFIIDKHPVNLALLVQREIESLTPTAVARDMKFIYKMPKNVPELELDENKIQQVVMNFSDNALYYSKEQGKITITLKKVPGWIELLVKDDGIGVPKAEQAHLFKKFFRATNARRARPDGTGVGLFLAKKVIDAHDGELIFESKEGKGSTFGFRLPIPKKK
jgi:signal transduction histidine kinase